jgi:ACS family tartrate transporter-like MFS transporter
MVDPTVWLMSGYYCLVIFGFYAINYWTPSVIREATPTSSTTRISFLSAIPFVAAAVGMVIAGIVADRTGRRRIVIAACTACGVVGTFFVVRTDSVAIRVACLSLAAAGIWGTLGPFWSLPPMFLKGPAAAAGVALINSVGNLLGGFIGPFAIGHLKEGSKDFRSGFLLTSIVLFGGLIMTPLLKPRPSRDRALNVPRS